ncbi:MAG: sulfite exporter TauE/SafE family protein [Betaproteobacteria bacterium]|nr:sulfite exporter TauE/SafE family protein [Betaproteobacteria bacterium]
MSWITWLAAYLAIGAVIGFLAGLLGIGGGLTLVPILSAIFAAQSLSSDHIVHMALATAMASVVFTSSSSVLAHHRLGSVDWTIVRRIAPAMVAGSFIATVMSGWLPQRVLAIGFALVVYGGATQMLLGRKPAPGSGLPRTPVLVAIGVVVGVICGLASAGGAFLTVPLMLAWGVVLSRAIGTAAAIGVPVAVVGMIGHVIAGWGVPGLPAWSLGFIYLPALVAVVAASVLTAPFGARLAHRMPVALLKRIFAVLLYALATKMIITYG